MTPCRKKCPHVVHFNEPCDWFESNSRHQKRYSEGGKKIRGCRGLLGRVTGNNLKLQEVLSAYEMKFSPRFLFQKIEVYMLQ